MGLRSDRDAAGVALQSIGLKRRWRRLELRASRHSTLLKRRAAKRTILGALHLDHPLCLE
jgi:hypothetical protein